jgi:hypothetical protein
MDLHVLFHRRLSPCPSVCVCSVPRDTSRIYPAPG